MTREWCSKGSVAGLRQGDKRMLAGMGRDPYDRWVAGLVGA